MKAEIKLEKVVDTFKVNGGSERSRDMSSLTLQIVSGNWFEKKDVGSKS